MGYRSWRGAVRGGITAASHPLEAGLRQAGFRQTRSARSCLSIRLRRTQGRAELVHHRRTGRGCGPAWREWRWASSPWGLCGDGSAAWLLLAGETGVLCGLSPHISRSGSRATREARGAVERERRENLGGAGERAGSNFCVGRYAEAGCRVEGRGPVGTNLVPHTGSCVVRHWRSRWEWQGCGQHKLFLPPAHPRYLFFKGDSPLYPRQEGFASLHSPSRGEERNPISRRRLRIGFGGLALESRFDKLRTSVRVSGDMNGHDVSHTL